MTSESELRGLRRGGGLPPRVRILLIAEYSDVGGTRTYAEQLVRYYGAIAEELHVVALNDDGDGWMRDILKPYGGFFYHYGDLTDSNSEPWTAATFPAKMGSEYRSLKGFTEAVDPDLVVASVGTPGRFLGHLLHPIQSVYILHTYPGTRGRSALYNFVRGVTLRYQLPRKTKFVTVSKFSKSRMDLVWGLGIPPSRVRVIHNTAGPPIAGVRTSRGSRTVLTIAHVMEHKNPMEWIKIAKEVLLSRPNSKFVWVGPGPLLAECRRKVTELGLEGNVFFVGKKTNVEDYYRDAAIYAQTSRVEALSISVLEAMRFGLPCVTVNVGGLPELISHGETGFVEPSGDYEAFAARVISLLDDSECRLAMGKKALTRYNSKFAFDKWQDSMDIFHEHEVW